MTYPYSSPSPRPSTLPLVLAGIAIVMTGWLAWERLRPMAVHVDAEPRAIEPRGELAELEKSTIRIFDQTAPSVVHISSRALKIVPTYRGWARTVQEGTGTGFVWDERGYIVTNWHVVQSDRSDLIVRFQGLREEPAVLVGGAPELDIAVVKVRQLPSGVQPVLIGTSSDLRVGQSVFAIGNPFGLDQTLTTGVVSALDREIETGEHTTIQGAIQVDAAINPGNSGGPLLDSAGRLIGMNTSIISPSRASAGIGFAIPVDTINRTVPRLISGDPGSRPGLGVTTDRVPMADGTYRRMIRSVQPGSGAEQAGLVGGRYGDIILEVDGTEVHSHEELTAILDQKELGQTVRLKILRSQGGNDFRPMDVDVPLKVEIQRDRD